MDFHFTCDFMHVKRGKPKSPESKMLLLLFKSFVNTVLTFKSFGLQHFLTVFWTTSINVHNSTPLSSSSNNCSAASSSPVK